MSAFYYLSRLGVVLFVDHCEKRLKKKVFISALSFLTVLPTKKCLWPVFGFSCQTSSSVFSIDLNKVRKKIVIRCSYMDHFFSARIPFSATLILVNCRGFLWRVSFFVYRHSTLWLESPICRLDAFSLCLHVPTWVKQLFGLKCHRATQW